MGFGFGYLSRFIINKITLDFEGLYPVLAIALMFITFSATDNFGGNGFLAVYLCGVFLGNHSIIHKKTIIRMFDGLAWLMQIVMFLTLGLLVTPSDIWPVLGIGLIISFFLIFVARPLSVFISLAFFKMRLRRRLYISWVGLRGAVPIVFATYPLIAGIEKAQVIFNIVFFVSLSSVLIQGTTLGIVANWLRVSLPGAIKRKSAVERLLAEDAKSVLREINITCDNPFIGKPIVDFNFPKGAIIAMIMRNDKFLTPSGSTVIEEDDTLVVLAGNNAAMNEVYKNFQLKIKD